MNKQSILLGMLVAIMTTLYAPANAQVINGYAKVTSISGTVLSVSNVNEGGDSFEDDEWVLLIQMQDNVIGTTTNSATFGSLGAIGSVGTYEIRQIDSHTETAGSPTTITLKNAPVNTYSTGPNASLQIVTFREYGSPDYTTTSNMSALAWDGNIGGVVAFFVALLFFVVVAVLLLLLLLSLSLCRRRRRRRRRRRCGNVVALLLCSCARARVRVCATRPSWFRGF